MLSIPGEGTIRSRVAHCFTSLSSCSPHTSTKSAGKEAPASTPCRRTSKASAMDIDPEDLFREDSDSEEEFRQEREASKEFVVYLIDASPKMFVPFTRDEDEKGETPFHIAISCVLQSLKTQIIAGSFDEVAVCFFNTKQKKNLQDVSGVYAFDVMERESLDRPTARFIKEFSNIEESFLGQIGSCYCIVSGSRENSIYNALWVAQALLRKGSSKTATKRILMFTNEDDPFGSITGPAQMDMVRTTLQRAKDAQGLGISIELLPLSRPDEDFNISKLYAELLGLENEELSQFVSSAGERVFQYHMSVETCSIRTVFKPRKIPTESCSMWGYEIYYGTLEKPSMEGTREMLMPRRGHLFVKILVLYFKSHRNASSHTKGFGVPDRIGPIRANRCGSGETRFAIRLIRSDSPDTYSGRVA
ncbi:hypothetical protein Taro_023244, partial [Colocasia esculenta]|nr:hypothetical protein [Colocasia esculenta]